MIFTRVDLPAPFSPSKAWISPGLIARLIPSLATVIGKRLEMPSRASSGVSPRAPGSPAPIFCVILARLVPPAWTGVFFRGFPGGVQQDSRLKAGPGADLTSPVAAHRLRHDLSTAETRDWTNYRPGALNSARARPVFPIT